MKTTDNIHAEYGNAGYKFPRSTQEAFGPGACVFVASDYDEDDDITGFYWYYGIVIYTLAAIVIGIILWG